MKTVKIYHCEEIKDLEHLAKLVNSCAPVCFDPPEKNRCECENCFEYEITIDKISKIKQPRN